MLTHLNIYITQLHLAANNTIEKQEIDHAILANNIHVTVFHLFHSFFIFICRLC